MTGKIVQFRRRVERTKVRKARMTVGALAAKSGGLDTAEALAPLVRSRMKLPVAIGDEIIADSIREVMKARGDTNRWWAAYYSTMGLYLSLSANDFDRAIGRVIAFVPRR
jgi:hypothetical protein